MCPSLYGQIQQVVVSFITTKMHLKTWLKSLSNDLHKFNKGFHLIFGEVLGELRAIRNFPNLLQKLVAYYELDTFVAQ